MINFGYAIATRNNDMGGLEVQVRIPSVHGAYHLSEYRGQIPRNYIYDKDLPWYPMLKSPYKPGKGDVVVISTTSDSTNNFIILGVTGSTYEPQEVDR